MKPRISCHMYTLRKSTQTPEDFEQTLGRVAEMGYKSVQITPPKFTTVPELAKQLASHGLSADSAYCPVYDIPEKLDEIARNAEALGTDVLRTNSIRKEDRLSKEGYQSFAAHLNACGKELRKLGLDFMYHFHAFEWIRFDDTTGIDILLNETDPENVMFQPDIFWLTAAGTEPSRSLAKFKGRMRYIHCKDYYITQPKDGVLERYTYASGPVGYGNESWHEIFQSALALGVENFVTEDDIGKLDPFVSAKMGFDYLTMLSDKYAK